MCEKAGYVDDLPAHETELKKTNKLYMCSAVCTTKDSSALLKTHVWLCQTLITES